jgi:hypothetical protein
MSRRRSLSNRFKLLQTISDLTRESRNILSGIAATGEQQKGGMTAVRMYEHGGPEVLKVERHSIPTPDANEVLI